VIRTPGLQAATESNCSVTPTDMLALWYKHDGQR
jgi:hypothetical protein